MNTLPKIAVIAIRFVPVIAILLMYPLAQDALTGEPGALQAFHEDAADLLGTTALFTLLGSFAVTPLRTVTGWRWHLILARDLGLWTAALALADVVVSMATAEDGWLAGMTGNAVLASGTLAALLLVPLALTSNRFSMRKLGKDWKRLHRLVYMVIAAVALHLCMLEGVRGIVEIALFFGPLIVLRLGPVRRWFTRRRKRRTGPAGIIR
jgi:methionine sulfoxide reductase heme-binding subunit